MRVVAATALQDVVAQANRAILRATDQQELFDATCRIAVDRGGLRMAWVGMVDVQAARVRPVAHAGLTDGYLDGITVTLGDEPEGNGPVGTAVKEGRLVVADDITTDPAFAPWREAATARGYRSSAALPLRDDGDVVGVLAVYATEPCAFDERDLLLLRELADDVSFGLRMQRLDRQRRLAQQAHRDSEQRLRFVVDNLPGIVWVVDRDLRVVSHVGRGHEALGLAPDSLVGVEGGDLMGRGSRAVVAARAAVQRGSSSLFEERAFGRWWQTQARPLHGPDGEISGAIGLALDVTELRQVEEMKSTFLAAVSHELRTPLTGVIGFTRVLREQYDTLDAQRARVLLDRLAHNAVRLEGLLEDLLDVDRLARGAMLPKLEVVRVDELILRTIQGLDSHGRHITTLLDSVVTEVDPPKVERIVENLLVNAIRHTDPEAAIRVRLRTRDDGVLITVEDRGAGVPDDLKTRIFEPFQLGDNAAAKVGGTGIGLTIVARFAELHGGRAWVEDVADGGAAFHVWLPGRTSIVPLAAGTERDASFGLRRGRAPDVAGTGR